MTDLSHYRVGPTKTRDGRDAIIYAIYPGQRCSIHGAFLEDTGRWVCTATAHDDYFLLPNNLPATVARWLPPDGSLQVSDTERDGWTRVEVPVHPVRGALSITGYSDADGDWLFGPPESCPDTHRLTLPTDGGDLVCGDYRDGAGNVIKVEKIK